MDDDEVPLGLVLEDDVPLPLSPVVDDDDPPVPLPDMLPDGELLEVPPMPELGLVLELDEPDGVLGVVVVEEDEEPPGTTTVSRVVLEVELGGVVAAPGTTVVVSFFSHADKANAPTTAKRIPLRLIFTLLSSEKSLKIAHDGIAIAVPRRTDYITLDQSGTTGGITRAVAAVAGAQRIGAVSLQILILDRAA